MFMILLPDRLGRRPVQQGGGKAAGHPGPARPEGDGDRLGAQDEPDRHVQCRQERLCLGAAAGWHMETHSCPSQVIQ